MSESNSLPYTGEAIANHAMGPMVPATTTRPNEEDLVGYTHAELISMVAQVEEAPVPTLDVDAWWEQREQMIAKLVEREQALETQLEETRRRLAVLGHSAPVQFAAEQAIPPRVTRATAAADDVTPLGERICAALVSKPMEFAALAKRLGISDVRIVRTAVKPLIASGRLKRSGRGGALVGMAKK